MKGYLPPASSVRPGLWSVGIALGDQSALAEARRWAGELSIRIAFEQPSARRQAIIDSVQTTRPDILILEVDPSPETAAGLMEELKFYAPDCYIIGVGRTPAPDDIIKAMRLGCNDFAWPPLTVHLGAAVARARDELAHRAKGRTGVGGAVLGFLSAKGGCGATTLACHIAAEMRHLFSEKTLLLDLDFVAGLVGFFMHTERRHSFLDVLANTHRLDSSYWGALVTGRPGLDILSAPPLTSTNELPPAEAVSDAFRFLRSQYRLTIVDLGRGLGQYTDFFLDYVDRVLLVTTTDEPALEQARRLGHHFQQVRNPRIAAKLILNRVPHKRTDTPELGVLPLFFEISSDYPELYEATMEGKLVSRKSRLGKEFTQAAKIIAGLSDDNDDGRRVVALTAAWERS